MANIAAMARNIVASGGENVLDDYYAFYNDGKWMVTVARKILSVLSTMAGSISDYATSLPKLEECIGYVSDVSLDEMGTKSCAKELGDRLSGLKDKYSEWEKAEDSKKAGLSDEYRKMATDMKEYVDAFEKSCVNMVRNRYIEDEENVRNLLDVIHKTGNFVLNNNAGNSKNSVPQLEKR